MAPLRIIDSIQTFYIRKIDFFSEEISWKVCDEFEAMSERLYSGDMKDLEEFKMIRKGLLQIWDEMKEHQLIYKDHPVFQHNHQVILICALILWGSMSTTEGLD